MWRARFERESLPERARLFEVALPALLDGDANGGSSSTTASECEELAGVGLAFYAQVFALEVRVLHLARPSAYSLHTYPPHHLPYTRCCRPPCRGTR